MISIFRKLRKSLIKSGNTRKYLLYAIGEIALVVIGILIALQINNWNQKRLELNEEKVILSNLKEDFQSAMAEFESLNSIRNQIISAAKQIIRITPETVNNYQTNYLDSLFSRTLGGPTYNNKAGSLDVLLTSGKINLISNQNLKKKLISWPGDVDDMIEDEVDHNEIYTGKYCDIMNKYLSWNDLVKAYITKNLRFGDFALEPMPENPVATSNYKGLLGNKEFVNVLSRRTGDCMISNTETEVLIEKAKEIISIIDNEVSN